MRKHKNTNFVARYQPSNIKKSNSCEALHALQKRRYTRAGLVVRQPSNIINLALYE